MKNLTAWDRRVLSALRRRGDPVPGGARLAGEDLDPVTRRAAQEEIERIFRRHRTVGGVVGLILRGRPLPPFAYGRARLSPEIPATAETLFRVASVSKLAFTFPAMTLVERGLLALDADISEVLGYPVRHPAHPDIPLTLRQLLTHTAALLDGPEYDGPGIRGELPLGRMLAAPEGRVNFAPWAPGTRFHYSNFGAGIVGSLVERVTGQRFADVVSDLLLRPLDIRGSFAPQRLADIGAEVADGYAVRPFRKPRLAYDAARVMAAPLPPVDPEYDFMAAPGRLVTDAEGLSKLLLLLCSDGQGVLSPESLREMRALQDGRGSVTGVCGRGLNVAFVPGGILAKRPVIGHQGVAYGQNAEAWIDPESRSGVVMLTSGTSLFAVCDFVRTGFEMVSYGFSLLSALS